MRLKASVVSQQGGSYVTNAPQRGMVPGGTNVKKQASLPAWVVTLAKTNSIDFGVIRR
ncbi:hypothetical protein PSDVSF_15370 [Pseudodesulfovibrio sediminis]|uniref:Uncharacterized protein n=1 Tax=Pseudodesulfovibrio sediminis TaxID=2810563 RepID=A0ABM7P3T3_9BACT|nr:hypothetical protein PSDVSF_15370 [Pseudodesulfovibrio sediminis]